MFVQWINDHTPTLWQMGFHKNADAIQNRIVESGVWPSLRVA